MRLRSQDTTHAPAPTPGKQRRWVVMLVENDTYPADVRVRNEAEALVAAGYRVSVIAPNGGGQPRRESIDGVEVERFWLPATAQNPLGFVLEYAVAHLQLARLTFGRLRAGADALHINNPPDTLALLFLLTRLFKRRAVFDNHDLFPELFELRYGRPSVTKLLRLFQRTAFRRADLVFTTNESQRELVLEAIDRDPASVVVVRNGPREATVSNVADATPAAAGGVQAAGTTPAAGATYMAVATPAAAPTEPAAASTDAARVELLFLGALEPQDGVIALADLLQVLVTRHRLDAHLTVVGAGSCAEPLRTRCAELGVDAHLTLTGRVPHSEVPALLERADVCVDPAPCNELNHASTMMKIAEYMAAGKPIVAFELRETRRTAADAALYAACGEIDDFAAQVAKLAASAELRGELTQAARERLGQLVWERSAEALTGAYARLFASTG